MKTASSWIKTLKGNICVFSGHFYTRQKCINSTVEAPFYRGHGGILQPYCRYFFLKIFLIAGISTRTKMKMIPNTNISQGLAIGGHLPLCLWLLRVSSPNLCLDGICVGSNIVACYPTLVGSLAMFRINWVFIALNFPLLCLSHSSWYF